MVERNYESVFSGVTVSHMAKIIRSTFIALAASIVAVFAFSSVAGAQTSGPYVGNTVTSAPTTAPAPSGQVLSNTATAPAAAAATPSGAVKSNTLAFTGSDASTLALIGVIAVAAGVSILAVRRRATA